GCVWAGEARGVGGVGPAVGPQRAAEKALAAGRRPAARPLGFVVALWRPALVLGGLFGVWWFVAARGYVPRYLMPTPREVWDAFSGQWRMLAHHTAVTLYETVIGFGLAIALGLVTAVAITYSRTFDT